METAMPRGYSLTQIALHWIVAVLMLAQFLNEEAIGQAWRALRRGAETIPGGFLVSAHVFVGIAVLAFAVWRLALRFTRGVPPPPAEEPRPLRLVSAVTHGTLYLLLLLVPLSGLLAWYGGIVASGEVHEVLQNLLMLVIFLHIAGALFQQFVLRSGAIARMVRAER
jgi:cytochrome b561